MNSFKKNSIAALAISAFFLAASTTVVAEGYTQKQNKIIDEQDRKAEGMRSQDSGQQHQQGQQGSGGMSGQSGQGSSSGMDSGHGSGSTGSSGSSGGSNSSSGSVY
ncbi:MAG: hypothetical protein H0V39_04110 [Nitrosomonas sp.]|nr:hypothetical protein [Nitrosomonas sp.]